jgi:hypothetical protein
VIWLLVAGCWLLVAGCWLLVAGCLRQIRFSTFGSNQNSKISTTVLLGFRGEFWVLVTGYWLLDSGSLCLLSSSSILHLLSLILEVSPPGPLKGVAKLGYWLLAIGYWLLAIKPNSFKYLRFKSKTKNQNSKISSSGFWSLDAVPIRA